MAPSTIGTLKSAPEGAVAYCSAMGSGAGAGSEGVEARGIDGSGIWRSRLVLLRSRWVGTGHHAGALVASARPVRWVRVIGARVAVRSGGLAALPWRRARRRALRAQLDLLREPPEPASAALLRGTAGGWSELVTSAHASSREVLCFAPFDVDELEPGWLARMQGALGDGAVAATPTLVRPARGYRRMTEHDGLVASAGFDIEVDGSGAPRVIARGAGQAPRVLDEVVDVPAAPLQCLVVDRAAYVAVGGLVGSGEDPDCASIDLCERLRARGGRIVHVPSALVVDSRDVRSRRSLRCPVEGGSTAWDGLIATWGPRLARGTRAGASSPMRLAISTAVPSRQVCRRWGDWHVAEALARALRRQGVDVVVSTHPEAASPAVRSCDVHVVLRGLAPVDRTPGQQHVVWVISHPETIATAECDAADLVLVASPVFADELRARTSTPVEVLLQATDPDRFCPGPPSREHRHDVTVVAKSREVRRRIVTDAIQAGLEPTIYGSGWRGLVEPRLVRDEYIDNAYLPHVYRSAGVVLNDHWDSMRRSGFVSNRLYDVLACGTPVISDEVAGIPELFDDAVPMYRTPEHLASLVHRALDEPERARAEADRGRAAVLRRHTFDHRAQQLLALLHDHQLDVRGRTPLPT